MNEPSGSLSSARRTDRTARRGRLLELLRDKAVTFGDFVLASGKRSRFYLDGRLVTLHPEGAWLIASEILDVIAEQEIRAVAIGGLTLGADPIAGATAAMSFERGSPLSAFIVRKEAKGHGKGRRVEGPLSPGMPVVVVDDVITTAGSTLQAIRAVEEIGCSVAAVLCLVDRQEGGREALAGYRFYPLFCVADLVEGSGVND